MQRTGNFFASPLLGLKAVFLVLTITVFWGCTLGDIINRPMAGTLVRYPSNAEITRTPHQVFDLKPIVPPRAAAASRSPPGQARGNFQDLACEFF